MREWATGPSTASGCDRVGASAVARLSAYATERLPGAAVAKEVMLRSDRSEHEAIARYRAAHTRSLPLAVLGRYRAVVYVAVALTLAVLGQCRPLTHATATLLLAEGDGQSRAAVRIVWGPI